MNNYTFLHSKIIPSSIYYTRNYILILAFSLLVLSVSNAQSVWSGSVSSSWTEVGNWSAGGVPTSTSTVSIPDVTIDPIISASGALAKSITVNASATLTISGMGTLTINNSVGQGILNNGTINNTGTLIIGTTSTVGANGIQNNSIFNNNVGGTITINRSTSRAIFNNNGTFTNQATINIGSTNSVGLEGINNKAIFNNTSGSIIIERTSVYGIYCDISSTFSNNASVTIGSATIPTVYLIFGDGSFSNGTGGTLKGSGFISSNAFVTSGGTLIPGYSPGKITFTGKENFNNGTINIEVNGKITPGIDFDQIILPDTTTFGGTLALSINFPSATQGDEIPIFVSNGKKDTFDIITGLPTNWFLLYRNTGAVLRYGALAETAWIGDSSTVWSDADNWSNGIPTALSDIFINDTSTFYPVLTATGIGKSLKIKVGGSLTITSTGTLNIEGSNDSGIKNDGLLDNSGSINIGTSLGTGFIGIQNTSIFNNNAGASIKINRSTAFGLYNAGGTFTNKSVLEIGGLAGIGSNSIWNAAVFNNNAGSQIKLDGSTDAALFNDSLAIFDNSASINMGSISNVGNYGVKNKSAFNNNSGSSLTINRTIKYAIYHTFNIFNNSGNITIGSTNTIGDYGMAIVAAFNNNTGGQIIIDRATIAGIINYTTTFTNQGSITIGAINPIANLIEGTSGIFSNATGGILKGSGNVAATIFSNAGGTLSPGYSPGLMTFTASENFANSIMSMDVNGNGTPGVNYDRIAVTGSATLGGTLNLNFAYAGAPGDQIQILTATSVAGTFATVTGLPAEWTLDYSATAVTLTYITAGSTTWTGAMSSAWTLAGNWSSGVPIFSSNVIIPDVANDPTISSAVSLKAITVNTAGVLNITSAGSLVINGSSSVALMNNGTVNNNGIVNIGATSSVGSYGLRNAGTFNNNVSSQLVINRASNSALENTGTLINVAAINIGGISGSGANGIRNTASFNNNSGGVINIDRTDDAGLLNIAGATFTNNNILVIGNSFNVGEQGILNAGTFNSNSGSQLTINRATEAGIENSGTFTNVIAINIGTLATPGNNGVHNFGLFNNNSAGSLNINRSLDAGTNNDVGGTFNNLGSIVIGANQSVGQYGVWNSGTFTNSGTINIDRSAAYGLWSYLGTFNNQSIINIGNNNNAGTYGLYNNSTFNNAVGSSLSINRTSGAGIYNFGIGVFNNNATINIGSSASVGIYGINNLAFFNHIAGVINIDNASNAGIYNDNDIFTNLATINIGAITSTGLYGIRNRDVFNNTSGMIDINRATSAGIYIEAGTLANEANMVIGKLVPAAQLLSGVSGSLDNNTGGIFKGTGSVLSNHFSSGGGRIAPGYSPGIMTFTGPTSFNNSIVSIEVNGKNTAGTDFDRVVVSGAATLGGTLEVINHFPAAIIGDQVTILTATSVAGVFGSVIGLPSNWTVIYTATSVILTLGPSLPVELLGFKASLNNSSVHLDWQTASERDNKGFDIERSSNGKDWNKIGFVAGKGTSQKIESYKFDDELTSTFLNMNKVVYYRLRQMDFNGKIDFSGVEYVNLQTLNSLANLVKIYPNPTTSDFVQVKILSDNLVGKIQCKLFTSEGALVKIIDLNAGNNLLETNGLTTGTYIIHVLNAKEEFISKIVIIK